MAQVTSNPPPPGTTPPWGDDLNTFLEELKAQGNASDAVIAALDTTIRETIATSLVAGANVTLDVNPTIGTVTISATGGSGGGGLDIEGVRDVIGSTVVGTGLITVTVNDVANTVTISTNATQNATDAALRDRSTHTGTQPQSSIVGLPAALSGKINALNGATGLWIGTQAQYDALTKDPTVVYVISEAAPPSTAPTIQTTTLNPLIQNAAFNQTISRTGTAPITWSVTGPGSLPPGIVLNTTTGVLSGTPTSAGSYSFTLTATNDFGTDSQAYSGTVAPPAGVPTITTTTLDPLTQGASFSQTLAASGATPITWSVTAGTLPAGLTLGASTGILSGTPSASGAYSFTVTATNSAGNDTQAYSGTIAPGSLGPQLNVFSASAPASPYSGATANADGGGSLLVGNNFYTTRPNGISVEGLRFWNPASANSAFLTPNITAWAFVRDITSLTASAGPPNWASPDRTKVHSTARTAGTWTPILFDTPITIDNVAAAADGVDLVTLAVQLAGGNHYVAFSPPNGSELESVQNDDVFLSDSSVGRGVFTLTGTGGSANNTWYGIDIIYRTL